jgi:hypothetical protein
MGIREARGLGFNRSSLRRPDEGERVHCCTVALNNGSKCVARQTDGVVSATGGAMIIGGNPTVLA